MYRSRYRRIVLFFARILFSFTFWDLLLPRLGMRSWTSSTRSARMRRSAAAFRALAVSMGGVLIKVGQFLSSRVDVLPVEITSELAGLQDEVPAENFDQIRLVAETEFGMRLDEKFAAFETSPLAAASLGQAHRARIHSQDVPANWKEGAGSVSSPGEPGFRSVVVKIQRPDIEKIIDTDLAALRTVGNWLRRYPPIRRRANVPALLDEFTRILYEEIDYLAEGHNAETFAANFHDQPEVRVPRVIWTHTTRRVLTLENVWGIKITDYGAISAAGVDRGQIATRLLDTYLQQIFEDGFFHADPHPGNLFVYPLPPASVPGNGAQPAGESQKRNWQLTFVDFGMVGHVPPNLKEGLREMLIGIGTRDPAKVVNSYKTLGVLLPYADLALIEKAGSRVFDRFWGKTMNELREVSPREVRELAIEFRQLIYTMPFQVPSDIIYLARAVGILSGICTGLDPNFNIWDHLGPYARKLIAAEASQSRGVWLGELELLVRSLLTVPRKMDAMLTKMEQGEIAVRAPEVSKQVNQIESAIRQMAGSIIFIGLLLGGIQLYQGDDQVLGKILLAAAGLCLLWVIAAGIRRKPE